MKDCDGQMVPGVAPAAVQMGAHIAKTLKSELEGATSRPAFDYFDKGMMAIIGKNYAVVKAGKMRLQGFIAWLAWLFIHIAFLIGFRNKLSVLLGWAYSYLVNNPSARIIVNPPVAVAPGKPPLA
jgi:NADH dehydrogenase